MSIHTQLLPPAGCKRLDAVHGATSTTVPGLIVACTFRAAYGAWFSRMRKYGDLTKSAVEGFRDVQQWSAAYLPELQATLRHAHCWSCHQRPWGVGGFDRRHADRC